MLGLSSLPPPSLLCTAPCLLPRVLVAFPLWAKEATCDTPGGSLPHLSQLHQLGKASLEGQVGTQGERHHLSISMTGPAAC